MTTFLGSALRPLVGVSPKAVAAFRKGDSPRWRMLERSVGAAIAGYHATLDNSRLEALIPRLEQIPADLRGYAYEGAAMGLAGLGCVFPWNHTLHEFIAGAGAHHIYMVHIGVGEALARLRQRPEKWLHRFDPVLRWLILDGYGFHEGFFAERSTIEGQRVPDHLSPYARRIFDQGLGRAIWFLRGADVAQVVDAVARFPPARHADLWAGVGVCCAYAGGANADELELLRKAAGEHASHLAMGVAVVAKGRQRAGNPVGHSDLACAVLCQMPSDAAAAVVDEAFVDLPPDGEHPAFATLQQRLVDHMRQHLDMAHAGQGAWL